MKIGPILHGSVPAVQTKARLVEIFEDTQGKGAGKESSPKMPICYNTAKASEPMDWAEQTKTRIYKENKRSKRGRTQSAETVSFKRT
ncbi:unnamed protein product [Hymenolepis diminuta]|uniref:Uncharacterized protein n=1 Tax=Hymenolepis diminuta TaxID=6216 RepID=A0A564YH63_HYMDI|nr:unnamed protein product [Hymenolepis diminuta]